ncbi:MAG: hypothetical protein D3X82_16880 [Candidatus Leucobacter sulfamidivorax]|nr:hypothetical protein [Candidatus Leucobacter sulfamidivorax]
MADLHTALTARFAGSTILDGKLRDTAVDRDGGVVRGNYLLLFTSANPDELLTERETREQTAGDDGRWFFTLRAVAVDPGGCTLLLGEAFAELVGWAPTVAGFTASRIRHEGAEQIRPDNTLRPPLFFGEDDYSVRLTRT